MSARDIFLVAVAILPLVSPTPLLAQDKKGQKLALLVGVRDYDHPDMRPLRYSENDVVELGKVLKDAGYDVTLLADGVGEKTPALSPSRANIEKHLAEVLAKCKRREDTILIAFAGHGMQPEGDKDAYFCAKDANPRFDAKKTMVSLSKVYSALQDSFAGVKIVLVDACRDDPKLSRGRSGITGDTAPRPPRGVAVLFSCAAGEIAYEHEKYKHGVFFHHVLQGLKGEAKNRDGEVTFTSLTDYVSSAVARDVPKLIGDGAQQSPNLKADLAGASPVLLPNRPAEASRHFAFLPGLDPSLNPSFLVEQTSEAKGDVTGPAGKFKVGGVGTTITRWTALGRIGGDWKVRWEIVRIKLTSDLAGMKTHYDTDAPDAASPLHEACQAMLSARLGIVFDSSLTIKSVERHREWADLLRGVKSHDMLREQIHRYADPESFQSELEELLYALPPKGVAAGKSWKKEALVSTMGMKSRAQHAYTYVGDEAGLVKVMFAAKYPAVEFTDRDATLGKVEHRFESSESSGYYLIDPKRGLPTYGERQRTINGSMVMTKGSDPARATSRFVEVYRMRVLER